MATQLIHVIQSNANRVVHSQEITFFGEPTSKDFEDSAWEAARKNGGIPHDAKRADYRFDFLEVPLDMDCRVIGLN